MRLCRLLVSKKNIKQLTIYDYDTYFEEERELHKSERANITKKVKGGYINVDWYRKTLFNATSTGKCVKYKKPKSIYKNKGIEILVSHALNQKHADALSILFTDNLRFKKMLLKDDGSFYIYISLYHIAKKMGYKTPHGATHRVKKLLNDLRDTDFIIRIEIPNHIGKYYEIKTKILGDSGYSNLDESYRVVVGGKSAKVLAMSAAVSINKLLNEKIVSLPNNRSKLKALIRYVLASDTSKYGYTLKGIFERYNIGQKPTKNVSDELKKKNDAMNRKDKTVFRNQLREYKELLEELNIRFDEYEQKIHYKQHDLIGFDMGIKPMQILERNKAINTDKYIGKWIEPEHKTLAKITTIDVLKNNKLSVGFHIPQEDKKGKIKSISSEALEEIFDKHLNEYYEM